MCGIPGDEAGLTNSPSSKRMSSIFNLRIPGSFLGGTVNAPQYHDI